MRNDNRYVVELPTGVIRNPQLPIAGVDLFINDVVYLDGDTVYPMYGDSHKPYGIVAAKGVKGKPVLIAA